MSGSRMCACATPQLKRLSASCSNDQLCHFACPVPLKLSCTDPLSPWTQRYAGVHESQSGPISTGRPTGMKKCQAASVPPDSGLLDPCHLAVLSACAGPVQAQTKRSAASGAALQELVCATSAHPVATTAADLSGTPSLGLPAEASPAFRVYAKALGAHALHLQPLPDGRYVPATLEGAQAGGDLLTEVLFYHCLAPARLGQICTSCLLPQGTLRELWCLDGRQVSRPLSTKATCRHPMIAAGLGLRAAS
jgi:hypothetical protein